MKRLSLVVALAALALPQAGQAGWIRTYGTGLGYSVQVPSDTDYIVTGAKGFNLWIAKIDTSGGILWEKTYPEGYGIWVEETSDGDYIIAGYPGLYKIDALGDTIWTKNYNVASQCVQETSDKEYIVVGENKLLKTNENGDTLWFKRFTDPQYWYEFHFARVTNDSGYILTGLKGYLVSEEIDQRWLCLVKTNAQGDTLWTRTYRGSNNGSHFENYGFCVRQTIDGGYIVSGLRDPEGFWLLKTDSKGDTLWTKNYGGGPGYSVQLTTDGGYILTGGTETGVFSSDQKLPVSELWLIKTDSLGDTLWTRRYGGFGGVGRCVQQTTDKGYLALGASSDGLCLLKTDSLGNLGISEDPIVEQPLTWQITPTIGGSATLRFYNRSQGFKADVFNASGQKVDEIRLPSSSGCISWGNNQISGVYFIRSQEKNFARTVKVVIIH